ncbi:uncharacterized protein LOC113341143, partial [Papaver somniferum]|uniref:uncharacterized protein LOC113341143 n=1 Tax=Papaver somniferum TaxID=3469 RepID=UPI000E6FFC8A
MSASGGKLFGDVTKYRSLVGALQYLSMTRPDITYAVNQVSRFMHSPTEDHFMAVKRILRYLKGTLGKGLFLPSTAAPTLLAYSDADWGGTPDDSTSTSGSCVFLGTNLISWSSKKQPTVSKSSTEAEYRAMSIATSEVAWIQYLLTDLG